VRLVFNQPYTDQAVQRIPYKGFDLWGEIDPKDSPPETGLTQKGREP
jgi:hypothetical protein